MNKFRKTLAVCVCILMMSSTMTACFNEKVVDIKPTDGNSTDVTTSDNTSPTTIDKNTTGEISFWHFNKDEGPKIVEAFNKVYPNIKVNLTVIPDNDLQYQNKLQSALRSGTGVPDVFPAESAFVKRFVDMPDVYADLTDKASSIASNMVPYTVDIGRDKNKAIKALSHQAAVGAIVYKKETAKKYLGTDDPQKIAEMVSTQEKMLETAKILKEKSGGKVALFPSWEEVKKMYLGGREKGWVENNEFTIDQKVLDLIDFSKTLADNKYEIGLQQFTPGWASAISVSDKALMWACPTWGIPWIVGANDKKASEGGRWGIVKPPFQYFWGGTWFGIYKNSKNQDLAWEFVKFFVSDKEAMKNWAVQNQDFPNNLELISEGSPEESKIVGTNVFKFYEPFISGINGKILTSYDDAIEKDFNDLMRSYLAGKLKTKDDVVNALKVKVKNNYRDVVVK